MTESSSASHESIGSTSSSLLERVRAREDVAWRRLVGIYGHLVVYWCRCADVRREDHADICQDVFRAVARNMGEFRRDPVTGTFRGWLRTITRSKIADYYRRQRRQPTAMGGSGAYERLLAIPDGEASGVPEASDPETAILVRKTLELIRQEFEERTWQAFWQTTVEDLPPATVAETLGMRSGAVRQAKSRVLRRLREELNESPDPEEANPKRVRGS